MACAANSGYVEFVKLCKDWGATDFDGALAGAAMRGYVEIVELCREWGATDFDEAMACAEKGNAATWRIENHC